MTIGLAIPANKAAIGFYLGALERLYKENIPISYISGVKEGGAVAVLLAAGISPKEILEIFHGKEKEAKAKIKLEKEKFARIKREKVLKKISKALSERGFKYFSDIKKPVAIPMVDIMSQKTIWFLSRKENLVKRPDSEYIINGEIMPVIEICLSDADCENPEGLEEYSLMSGENKVPVPVDILRLLGAKKVISINNSQKMGDTTEGEKSCAQIAKNELYFKMLSDCDLVIEHIKLQSISEKELFSAGERAAKHMLPKILKLT